MKKYILIIALLVTSLAFSQGGYTKPVVTAINVTIADAGAIITATEVENALQENRTAIDLNTLKDTNVSTNLSLGTITATTIDVNSSDGTNATLLEANTTQAGLLGSDKWDEIVSSTTHSGLTNNPHSVDKTDVGLSNVPNTDFTTAVGLNTAKDTNVSTNLSEGTTTNTTVDVNSSDGTNATLVAASTSRAGVMTKAKFDEVVVNTTKDTNVSTDLTTTHNASTVVINSSDGTDATINAATATTAGIMSEAIYDAHVLNNAKTTNATHTGEVTGATALTVDATAISNKTTVTPVATDMLLLWDATDSALKKVDVEDFLGGGGTVTSVGTTGTVSGITLTGTVTTSGNLTLGGTLSLTSGNVTDGLGFTPYNATNPSGYTADQTSIVGITGTKAQFNTAVTDGNILYVGDVITNATHTSEVTGATALTIASDVVDKDNLAVALKTKVALGNVSGTVDIDTSLGIHFTMTLTGNVTSLTFSNLTNEELKTITLEIDGNYTFAQPASVKGDWTGFDGTKTNQIQIYLFDISTPTFSSALLNW